MIMNSVYNNNNKKNDSKQTETYKKASKIEKGGFCSLILALNWLLTALA